MAPRRSMGTADTKMQLQRLSGADVVVQNVVATRAANPSADGTVTTELWAAAPARTNPIRCMRWNDRRAAWALPPPPPPRPAGKTAAPPESAQRPRSLCWCAGAGDIFAAMPSPCESPGDVMTVSTCSSKQSFLAAAQCYCLMWTALEQYSITSSPHTSTLL